jgi:(p)ppGpp synthase/HD superfamily hydrolase
METPPTNSLALANLRPTTQDKVFEFQKSLDDNFEGYQRQVLEEALLIMYEVHFDQKDRPDGSPYVEHPLGVATNVLNSLERPDFEIVVAALLHDSVEDQPEKLAAKIHFWNTGGKTEEEGALHYIENRFGERVRGIISSLTNPDFAAELNRSGQEVNTENKNRLYAKHVEEAIENPDVLPIKLFDFAENALRLDKVTDPVRRLKLTQKYVPVVNIFIARLSKGAHNLKQTLADGLLSQLQDTHSQMQVYMETA